MQDTGDESLETVHHSHVNLLLFIIYMTSVFWNEFILKSSNQSNSPSKNCEVLAAIFVLMTPHVILDEITQNCPDNVHEDPSGQFKIYGF